jgi:hypothetical protein
VLSIAKIGSIFGDGNRDGHVNVSDVASLHTLLIDVPSFKSIYKLTDANIVALADLIHDGKVKNLNLQWLLDRLKPTPSSGSIAGMPEPTSVLLLLSGLASALSWLKQRRLTPDLTPLAALSPVRPPS